VFTKPLGPAGVAIILWVAGFSIACGGSPPTSPTQSTSPPMPTPPATTGILTGLVRETASALGDLDPVGDARVEVVSGVAAGRNSVTSISGEYRLQELPAGPIQVRVTKTGFQDFESTVQV